MPIQAAFFFGAGISRPSGMPLVDDLTDAIFNKKWHLTTAQTFEPGPEPNPAYVDNVTEAVKAFLRVVSNCASDYIDELNHGDRKPHYEDLFSLAEQASRSELDHIPNLAVVEFVRRLRRESMFLHAGFRGGTNGGQGFIALAETACDYIHWVVHHSLTGSVVKRSGLGSISQVARAVDRLDIFSLNHDLLIEDQLRSDGISEIEKGFNDRTRGQCSVFSGWPAERKRVRLFKLHGSLDWYFYEFPGWARQYAIPDGEPFHCHDQKGQLLTPIDRKAAFLSGTIVKEQRYGFGFWGELISNFVSHLTRHTHLICCGYSFGDPGINQRIAQWMSNLPGKNKLVILTPEHECRFFEGKPAWMHRFKSEGRVVLVPKYFEQCDLSDLQPYFDESP